MPCVSGINSVPKGGCLGGEFTFTARRIRKVWGRDGAASRRS